MQLITAALLSALLVRSSTAADDTTFISAGPNAGSATSDLFPPTGSMCC